MSQLGVVLKAFLVLQHRWISSCRHDFMLLRLSCCLHQHSLPPLAPTPHWNKTADECYMQVARFIMPCQHNCYHPPFKCFYKRDSGESEQPWVYFIYAASQPAWAESKFQQWSHSVTSCYCRCVLLSDDFPLDVSDVCNKITLPNGVLYLHFSVEKKKL